MEGRLATIRPCTAEMKSSSCYLFDESLSPPPSCAYISRVRQTIRIFISIVDSIFSQSNRYFGFVAHLLWNVTRTKKNLRKIIFFFTLTIVIGKLSTRIAWAYKQSLCQVLTKGVVQWGIEEANFKNFDFHIHRVPARVPRTYDLGKSSVISSQCFSLLR